MLCIVHVSFSTPTGMNIMRTAPSMSRLLFVIIGIMMIVTAIPVNGQSYDQSDDGFTDQPDSVMKGEDFTHSVMMELFVTTWCDRCPAAEEASTELNLEYRENFNYVSMICDVNDDADQRSEDYLVETYPTAVFDGGDEDDRDSENDTSGEKDKERYEGHIENCGGRDVSATPVDLTVDISDQGRYRPGQWSVFPRSHLHIRVSMIFTFILIHLLGFYLKGTSYGVLCEGYCSPIELEIRNHLFLR